MGNGLGKRIKNGSRLTRVADLKKKILIVSPSFEDQKMIEEVAQDHSGGREFEFQTTASFGQEASWWLQAKVDVVVLRLPEDELMQTFFFHKLKNDVPRTVPLAILTPKISQALLQLTPLFQKVRIMKTPVSGNFLYRLVVDLSTEWEEGKLQAAPRYLTEQEIAVGMSDGDQKIKAVMRNLSVSGVYFEAQSTKPTFKNGDVVKIHVILEEGRMYDFDATVVWVKDLGMKIGYGYGCNFVEMTEAYRNLIKKFE